MDRPVDIVIPVRDVCEELEECLERLHEHGGYRRVIVVDDGSTDERIGRLLRALASRRSTRVVALRNDTTRGFAAAVNRGFAASRNDVVVLAPRARATRGWLQKISRCAAADATIGTACLFTTGSGPCALAPGSEDVVRTADPARVARALELAAVPLYPELDVAGGDCWFVRRTLIRTIGGLDETLHDRIPAEREFSKRARAAGYRNVLCDDAVVFRSTRSEQARALPPRTSVAPGQTDAGSTHHSIACRRIEPIRRMFRSQLAISSREGKPGVVHVLHDRGGGTEKYVHDLIAATEDEFRHYFLRILEDRWRMTDPLGRTPTSYDYRWRLTDDGALINYDYARGAEGTDIDALKEVCAWLRIDLIHVHSLAESDGDLLQMLKASELPYCYTIHDMYAACPTVLLINSQGIYCKATTDIDACRHCLSGCRGLEKIDVAEWRGRHGKFLSRAARVFAPSKWASETLRRYYPGISVTLTPPSAQASESGSARARTQPIGLPTDGARHIGILGAIGPEKGARHIDAIVARIRERALPLRIVVIGYTDRWSRYHSPDNVLIVHGAYGAGEVATLLEQYRVSVVLFPTIWPETFAYTLSEAWTAGKPAVVPPEGALRERVVASEAGWVLDDWPNIDAALDQLMSVTAPENAAELARRSRLAAVARDSGDANAVIAQSYNDMLATSGPPKRWSGSRLRIYEAATQALDTVPRSPAA
jgi:glycosyltransferase involved in cell wall biosynthesis/GT2 family glycosyltransferase